MMYSMKLYMTIPLRGVAGLPKAEAVLYWVIAHDNLERCSMLMRYYIMVEYCGDMTDISDVANGILMQRPVAK